MLNRPKRDPALIRKIKEWAYECFPISKESTVSVMELQCHEPDCAPLETVIAVIEQKGKTRQWKFHKQIPDVTRKDLELASLWADCRQLGSSFMIFPDLENNDIPRRTLRKKPNNLKATREVSAYEKMLATRIANHLISQ